MTLDKLEKFQSDFLKRGVGSAYGSMKRAEEAFNNAIKDLKKEDQDLGELDLHLDLTYPEHHEQLMFPPENIQSMMKKSFGANSALFEKKYQFWEKGSDIKNDGRRPARNIPAILEAKNIWSLSLEERRRLSRKWKDEVAKESESNAFASFENLKKNHQEARELMEEYQMMVETLDIYLPDSS
jgi:hypothetical protein